MTVLAQDKAWLRETVSHRILAGAMPGMTREALGQVLAKSGIALGCVVEETVKQVEHVKGQRRVSYGGRARLATAEERLRFRNIR